jgi:uncharacterized Zn-binding protein involved in type VI secretion
MAFATYPFLPQCKFQNGSAAFHGGGFAVAFTGSFLRMTRKTPPWKAARPGDEVTTGARLTHNQQGRLESLPHKYMPRNPELAT